MIYSCCSPVNFTSLQTRFFVSREDEVITRGISDKNEISLVSYEYKNPP